MLIAEDENGNRVNINDAPRGLTYYCPLCKGEVFQKRGEIRRHHFAHKVGAENCDGWHYDMSDWHSDWQNQFPRECQEIVIRNEGEFHRADVLIGNVVIEFQHSSLGSDEFEERNRYYNNLGYLVIWLFDTTEQWNSTIKEDMFGAMQWAHSFNALKNYRDASGAVRVYLQAEESESENAVVAVKSVDPDVGIKCFECGNKYSKESFVSYVKAISHKKFGSSEVADIIFAECTNPELLRLIDCPVGNRNEFVNTNKPCLNCRWYKGYEKDFVPATTSRCGYRYRNIDMTIATINSIERFRDTHQIKELDYYDFDGNRRQVKFSAEEYSWRSIPEIWNSIDCSFMRCLNAVTGYCVQINKSPDEQRQKYGTIKGTGVEKRTLQSYRDFKEIKYADSKQWVLVYYKPKS